MKDTGDTPSPPARSDPRMGGTPSPSQVRSQDGGYPSPSQVRSQDGGTPSPSTQPGQIPGWAVPLLPQPGQIPGWGDTPPPTHRCGQTDTCENSTFPHTTYAGGNETQLGVHVGFAMQYTDKVTLIVLWSPLLIH